MDDRSHTVPNPVRILSRRDVARLMTQADYLAAVEAAFRAGAEGTAISPPPMHLAAAHGVCHAKGAVLGTGRGRIAVKINANFPGNPERTGLPTIQGAIVLCDAENGALLAVMDSIEITLRRTAAATALAAQFLARPESATVTLCGCGAQGRVQLEALAQILPLRRGFVWDSDRDRANAFAREMSKALGLDLEATIMLRKAARASDVVVTCTTAHSPFLGLSDVAPGVFVAAVGADNPDKSEIEPALMAAATVVVDALDQCAVMGDLHHAIKAGLMTAKDVHADLGKLVAGRRPGRARPDEIIVFDSTGTAIQDAASAALVHERAVAHDIGIAVAFGTL